MNDEFKMSTGQAHELALAFGRNNWSNAEVKKLCEGDFLAKILPVVRGLAEVKVVKHIINCDADPFLPKGWKKEKHHQGGQLEWDPAKVKLYMSKKQRDGVIKGDELRQELENKPVLNACVLDYLLANPHLIPEEWKGKAVFFWGTIYRSSGGFLCVRYLYWDVSRWSWYYNWLDDDWNSGNPAALLASV